MAARHLWVVAHRWAGLMLALFLCVAGLTGALLAFQTPLQRLIAPDQFVAAPAGAAPIDWLALRSIAERRSGGLVDQLPLHREGDAAVAFDVTPRPGQALGFDEITLDPYTGREIDRAHYGNLLDGKAQLLPFLYRLHYSLALGSIGTWAFGIAALIWTIDCFIGFYLTLPTGRGRFWHGWGKAWRIRMPMRRGHRLNVDLHRAGGLWLWPVLLVFAWTGVAFNLPPVYRPVMAALTGYADDLPLGRAPAAASVRLGWADALAAARAAASAEAAAGNFTILRERALYFDRAGNNYAYVVRTSRDRSDGGANSRFTIAGDTGKLLRASLPTGNNRGNTIDYWLTQLHVAGVFGLPWKIMVAIIGVMTATLSVTGILILLRKRSARLSHAARSRSMADATADGHSRDHRTLGARSPGR